MSVRVPGEPVPPIGEPRPQQVRGAYQRWLDAIDDELIGGALLVSEAIPRVTRAFLAADPACIDEAQAVASEAIERCRHVEEQGFLLLAREAPVAGDLRRLVSILRLVFAVERSAALVRHVADSLGRCEPRLLPPDVRLMLEELAGRSAGVFAEGLDAWRRRDALAVHEVDAHDSDVDTLRDALLRLTDRRLQGSSELLLLGLLARYYERIADHGVSFAQHAAFAATGERVQVGP
jgi:phosphate transport system protein